MTQAQFEAMMCGITALTTAFTRMTPSQMPAQAAAKVPAAKVVPITRGGIPARKVPQATKPTSSAVDPDEVKIVVSNASDKPLKLPARMFNASGIAIVDGVKYHGSESDAGRCKVQPSTFGTTTSGDTVIFERVGKNQWLSSFETTGGKRAKTAVPQAKAKPAPVPAKPKAAVPSNANAMKALVDKTAALAVVGYNKGYANENLPENDARRYLRSRDKKAFNVQSNAMKVKLADAIGMLNKAVFE